MNFHEREACHLVVQLLTEDIIKLTFHQASALSQVIAEMVAQDEKWGPMLQHQDMLEQRCPRAELVQVAAVAVQWIASIDARKDASA